MTFFKVILDLDLFFYFLMYFPKFFIKIKIDLKLKGNGKNVRTNPQGLSVNTIQLGWSSVRSTNWMQVKFSQCLMAWKKKSFNLLISNTESLQ